jgi:hypothetical protein
MTQDEQTASNTGCLIQLVWTLVGPCLLLVTGALLILDRPPLGTWPDFVLLGIALAVALARMADGRPPAEARTPGRRAYVAVLAAVTALILLVAHVLAPRMS